MHGFGGLTLHLQQIVNQVVLCGIHTKGSKVTVSSARDFLGVIKRDIDVEKEEIVHYLTIPNSIMRRFGLCYCIVPGMTTTNDDLPFTGQAWGDRRAKLI